MKVCLQILCGGFESLHMKVIELISYFNNKVIMIVNQIMNYGENVEDVCGVEDSSLSTIKFDFVVCAVEGSKDIELLTN